MGLNCVIFYFSQYGGTKNISEIFAKTLINVGHSCDLIQLTTLQTDLSVIRTFPFDKYHVIGIGTPVYYLHPPYHLFDVIKALPNLSGKRGFLFTTSGGAPGTTLFQMQKILLSKNLQIIAGIDKIICFDKHPFYRDFNYVFPPSMGHPNETDLAKAMRFGEELALLISDNKPVSPAKFWTRDSSFAKCLSYKNLNTIFPEFHLNPLNCTKCGLCAKICPVENIVLDPFPVWVHNCDRCYVCELKCPTHAIECDWDGWADFMNGLMKKKGFQPHHKPKMSISRRLKIMKTKFWISLMYLFAKFQKT